jgi:hypothetical protein
MFGINKSDTTISVGQTLDVNWTPVVIIKARRASAANDFRAPGLVTVWPPTRDAPHSPH